MPDNRIQIAENFDGVEHDYPHFICQWLPAPFIKHMLGTLLAAYMDFEARISPVDDKLPAIEMVRKAVYEKNGKFTRSGILYKGRCVGEGRMHEQNINY